MTRERQLKKFINPVIFRGVLVILIDIMAYRSFRILDKTDRLHGSDVTAMFTTLFKGKFTPFCECLGWLCGHYVIFCVLLLVMGLFGCVLSYIGYIKDVYEEKNPGRGYFLALLLVVLFMVPSFAAAEYCVLDIAPEVFIYRDTEYRPGKITSVSEPQQSSQLNPFAQRKNTYVCTYEYYVYDDSDELITFTSQMNTHVLYEVGEEIGVNIDNNDSQNSYVYEDIDDGDKVQAGVLAFIFIVTLNILAPVGREHSDDDNNGGVADDD